MATDMTNDASGAARRLMARLDELAGFTDEPGRLTRLYLSPSYRAACERYAQWAQGIGLQPEIDAAGNVHARYEGKRKGAPALMIGSHIDTVRDAGRYDGNLGALAALSVVEQLAAGSERLDYAIDIVAFGDEEGVRFPTTMTGSRALAGLVPQGCLALKDSDGITLRDALTRFGGDPDRIGKLRARGLAAFVELHIEQGPVLEAENLRIGTVVAINGATRLAATVEGLAGHAGAVPMRLRQDALAASAEMILAIEGRAKKELELVATVGRIDAEPGAVNVIPGLVRFSIDVRAPRDEWRRRAVSDIAAALQAIAANRKVKLTLAQTHEASAYVCDPRIVAGFDAATAAIGQKPFHLPSGAGHDTMIMGQVCPAGMLFVRCKGGISHNPQESIALEDCEIALAALTRFVRDFRLS
jgi:allantoate deiminase